MYVEEVNPSRCRAGLIGIPPRRDRMETNYDHQINDNIMLTY